MRESINLQESADTLEQKLRARRLDLSTRHIHQHNADTLGDFVIARRGDAKLAFSITSMREVRHVACVPLPKATDTIRALFHIRGQIHCLIDLWFALNDSPPPQLEATSLIILLQHQNTVLGVLIDEVINIGPILHTQLEQKPTGHLPFVSHATHDSVQLIETSPLFVWPSLLMDLPS